MKKFLLVCALALGLALPVQAIENNLGSAYNLNTFDETELTELETDITVVGGTDSARYVLFTATFNNQSGKTGQVTLTLHQDDVQVESKTFDIRTGNNTYQIAYEASALSLGGHTYEAFVSGTVLPLSFSTATELQAQSLEIILDSSVADFTDLGDTFASYTGHASKYLRVNSGETAIEPGLPAASTNTASTIVARDGSGDFAAGTITAALTGAVTGNASTATALAANGANCSAGSAPIGVDASGAVESCTAYQTVLTNSAGLLAALSDETGTGVAVFGTTPTIATPNLTGKGTYNGTSVDDDDCTGEQGKAWYDTTDSTFEVCNANSGAPVAITAPGSTLPAVDTTSIVEGSSDPTKEIRFEVDGLTGSTIRVLTPQDADYTLAGTTVALGGTGLTSGTSGGILGFTASGTLASSTALGNDNVIVGGGAGAVPTSSTNFTFDDSNFRLRIQNATAATDGTLAFFELSGTLPTTPSAQVNGLNLVATSAGSASQSQIAGRVVLGAGYTGSSVTVGLVGANSAAGTSNSLTLNSAGFSGNLGVNGVSTSTTTGFNYGVGGDGRNSSGVNVGHFGKAVGTAAGTNIGGLFNAANSTEGTDFQDIALYATLSSSMIAASNIDATAIFDNGAVAASMLRLYDNGAIMFDFADDGTFTASRTTNLGWAPAAGANTACNTTCTAACVFGVDTASSTILACTDATADSCLCAGAS